MSKPNALKTDRKTTFFGRDITSDEGQPISLNEENGALAETHFFSSTDGLPQIDFITLYPRYFLEPHLAEKVLEDKQDLLNALKVDFSGWIDERRKCNPF